MSTKLSAAAQAARENARDQDGKFGEQPLADQGSEVLGCSGPPETVVGTQEGLDAAIAAGATNIVIDGTINESLVISGDAQISEIRGTSFIKEVSGNARIERVLDYASVGEVSGNARIEYLSGEAWVGEVSGDAQIEFPAMPRLLGW